jgi:cytidylate kinase
VRGERRYRQQLASSEAPPENVLAELRARDRRDRERAASPLVAAPDAVIIDSTALSIDQVLERIEAVVSEKQAAAGRS